MHKLFDRYTIIAVFIPGIITFLPLIILWFFLLDHNEFRDLTSFLSNLQFFGSISLTLVLLYFYSQIIRTTSKYLERRYFICQRGFPTTYLMTYQDHVFSDSYKQKYHDLVFQEFTLNLLDKDSERSDPIEARKRLDEAGKFVVLKVANNTLVKEHNIWYGFFRNLIGGTIYSLLFCVISIILGVLVLNEATLIILSSILFTLYCILLIFRKMIIVQYGEAFARQAIAEFLIDT